MKKAMLELILLLFFVSLGSMAVSQAATLTGKIMYNGRAITEYTDKTASFWARDEKSGKVFSISPQYNTTTGEYSIPEVPPGEYGIVVGFDDVEPFDGRKFPGDYDGWNSPIVVNVGQSEVNKDLNCQKIMHLISPINNFSEIVTMPPPYDTYYESEMLFEWDKVVEACIYTIKIDKYQSLPYSFIERVFTTNTSNTHVTITLQENLENRYYQFTIYAYNAQGLLVGKLMIVYSAGMGWDYRFRIAAKP